MDVEQAFSEFLEEKETDKMFNNYLTAIREAFIKGYKYAMENKDSDINIISLPDYSIQSKSSVNLSTPDSQI